MTSSFWAQKLSPWSSAGKVWRLSTLGWEGSPTSRGSSISGSCWWGQDGMTFIGCLYSDWFSLSSPPHCLCLFLCVIVRGWLTSRVYTCLRDLATDEMKLLQFRTMWFRALLIRFNWLNLFFCSSCFYSAKTTNLIVALGANLNIVSEFA